MKGFIAITALVLLGGHCVGERAGEVVHELAIALQLKARVTDLAETIHAYPTYAELVRKAAVRYLRTQESRSER